MFHLIKSIRELGKCNEPKIMMWWFVNSQAVWEARIIGSSCPGYCLVTLDWKQPIYWKNKKETKKVVARLKRQGFTMFSQQNHF